MLSIRSVIAIFAIISCIYSPTFAANIKIKKPPTIESFSVVIDHGHQIGVIEIQGQINEKTVSNVHDAFLYFKSKNIKTVGIHLNSPGGLVTSGVLIGSEMLDAEASGVKVGTMVGHQEECASMCTAVFSLGNRRAAARDSLWVFHSPYVETNFWEWLNPFDRSDEARNWARQIMTEMYSSADATWAHGELSKYIYDDNESELMLLGSDIPKHSSKFLTDLIP